MSSPPKPISLISTLIKPPLLNKANIFIFYCSLSHYWQKIVHPFHAMSLEPIYGTFTQIFQNIAEVGCSIVQDNGESYFIPIFIPLRDNFPKSSQIFIDVMLLQPGLILHDVSGMLEGNNLFKESEFLIEAVQEGQIFSGSKTKSDIGIHAKGDLFLNALYHKIEYRLG